MGLALEVDALDVSILVPRFGGTLPESIYNWRMGNVFQSSSPVSGGRYKQGKPKKAC